MSNGPHSKCGFWRLAAYLLVSLMSFCASAKRTSSHEACDKALKPFSLHILQVRGINPAKFTIKFFAPALGHYEFRVRYEGKIIGVFEMAHLKEAPGRMFSSVQVTVAEAFEGKGLGSFMYLVAARWLDESGGAGLRSDFSPSDQAVAVWQRFVREGLARADGDYFYIDRERIAQASREIYPLFLSRIENPDFSALCARELESLLAGQSDSR